jgi:hypothetical protein
VLLYDYVAELSTTPSDLIDFSDLLPPSRLISFVTTGTRSLRKSMYLGDFGSEQLNFWKLVNVLIFFILATN